MFKFRREIIALRRSVFMEMLMAASAICLLLGLYLPVVRLTWLWFWENSHSILSVIWVLYQDQEYFLSVTLFSFSVVFPIFKLCYLATVYTRGVMTNQAIRRATIKHISWLGKWSMLDVLVLALVVFYVKQTGLADATALPGIYLFGTAIMLTMWAYLQCEQELVKLYAADYGRLPWPTVQRDRLLTSRLDLLEDTAPVPHKARDGTS